MQNDDCQTPDRLRKQGVPEPGIPGAAEVGIPATDPPRQRGGRLLPPPSLNLRILPSADRLALAPHAFQQLGQFPTVEDDRKIAVVPGTAPALLLWLCSAHLPKYDYLCSCRESKARGGHRREASPSSFKSACQIVSNGPLYFFVLLLFADQALVTPCRLASVRLAAPLQSVVELVLSGENRIIE